MHRCNTTTIAKYNRVKSAALYMFPITEIMQIDTIRNIYSLNYQSLDDINHSIKYLLITIKMLYIRENLIETILENLFDK